MKNVVVLGGGLVGSAISLDLAKEGFNVVTVEKDKSRIKDLEKKGLATIELDILSDEAIKKVVKDTDIVVGALPGFLGYTVLKKIIEEEKNVVDISFFPENPFTLDQLVKSKNLTVAIDCGVAPGLSNMLLGYAKTELSAISSFKCYVGGLPIERRLPFQYKAPFSPIDVIEEYIRAVRVRENGKEVIKEPLSEIEHIDFPGIGTLEAFNTDGLRTLIQTMPDIPNMVEKTLRYPGHIEKIKFLKECGFFDSQKMKIGDVLIRPIDLTSKILINHWKLERGEKDLTAMRIVIEGEKSENKKVRLVYELLDYYDEETNTLSMARTTGYTATAVVKLMLENKIKEKGVIAPEKIGEKPELFNYILKHLEARNIIIDKNVQEL